jgi:hypothetical protein
VRTSAFLPRLRKSQYIMMTSDCDQRKYQRKRSSRTFDSRVKIQQKRRRFKRRRVVDAEPI